LLATDWYSSRHYSLYVKQGGEQVKPTAAYEEDSSTKPTATPSSPIASQPIAHPPTGQNLGIEKMDQ
jgi:hypothetical protein